MRYGKLFTLGLLRFLVLVTLLGMITGAPPGWQLFLLPAGMALFIGRYVFQLPALRLSRFLRGRVSSTFTRETVGFACARERAILLLRRPPSFRGLALAMVIVITLVPFAWGEFGRVCARGELIRVSAGAVSPTDGLGRGGILLVALLTVISFVVLEEFTFRGWLLYPVRKFLGAPAAVAITGYLFAVVHLRTSTGLNDLFNGVLFGASAVLTGSIWTSVGIHLAHNAGVWGWDRFFDAFGPGAISCTFSRPAFLILAAALTYTLWSGRQRRSASATARIP